MTAGDWIAGAVILALIALSAFFSASETALTGASRARLHQLEQEGDRRARRVNRLRERKERVIGALLVGNNVVNILASVLATSVLIEAFGDNGVAYATGLMTVLVVLFAEVMPKTYALNYSERTALAVSRPIVAFVAVMAPLLSAMEWVVRLIFHLFGVTVRAKSAAAANEEELRGAIDLHGSAAEEEEEVREERAMLRSILDLNDVSVAEIMTHRRNLVMIDADLEPAQVVAEMLKSPFTRVPLWQDESDNIVGVLHAKALLREIQARGGQLDQLELLAIAAKPWFIPETTTLFDQLQEFRRRHEHFALVVDEYGGLKGIVTLEDILEEIVGDIADEHDVCVAGVRAETGGSYVVDGWVTLRDLNREFDWRLPDDKASTIAGLVLNEARRIPDVGERFSFYDFGFEILGRQRHQITTLRVLPPAELEAPLPEVGSAASG